jgi:tetratricopeptide (TPR) repeat protein
MEAGMTRRSTAIGPGFVLTLSRGLAAATLFGFWLCATSAGQESTPIPPDLPPLTVIPPTPPVKDLPAPFKPDPTIASTGDSLPMPGDFQYNSKPIFARQNLTTSGFGSILPDGGFPAGKTEGTDDKEKKPADDLVTRARSALQDKQFALGYWDKEIEAHPKEARCYFERGRLRMDEGKEDKPAVLDTAIADFARTLELDPEHVEARFLRGYAALQKHDLEAALADLSRVIEHHPDHALAWIARARVFLEKEDFDKALADLDRAAASRPGAHEPEMLLCRARCYAGKDDDHRAIAELTAVMERFPVEPQLLLERASYYQSLGDMDHALADIDEFLRIRPNDPSGEFFRVWLLAEAGRYIVAYREADRLREVLPDNPLPYFLRFLSAWLAACERDRWLDHVDRFASRIEPFLPSSPAPYLVHVGAARITGIGRKGALADMDRCIDLVPGLSFFYGVGAVFNAYEGRFIPTCRDLAIFLYRFDWKNYRLSASLDWNRRRLKFSFTEKDPHDEAESQPEAAAAQIGGKCMDMGLQQLLAALNSRR